MRKNTAEEFTQLEEIFESYFGTAQKENKNIMTTYNITKQQAKQGVIQNLKISVADICDSCKGKEADCQCKECNGKGYVYHEKTIIVRIPSKTKNNDLIIIQKQGNQFNMNEERGDIYVRIHIYGSRSKGKGKIIYE